MHLTTSQLNIHVSPAGTTSVQGKLLSEILTVVVAQMNLLQGKPQRLVATSRRRIADADRFQPRGPIAGHCTAFATHRQWGC